MCAFAVIVVVLGVVLLLGDVGDVAVARIASSRRSPLPRGRLQVGAHVGGVFDDRLGVTHVGVHHVHRHARVVLERVGVHALGAGPVRPTCRRAARRGRRSARPVGAHRARIGAALGPRLARLVSPLRADGAARTAGQRGSGSDQYDDFSAGSSAGASATSSSTCAIPLARCGARFRTRCSAASGIDVVGDDGDLAGQFGDGHRVGVAATTATAAAGAGAPMRAVLGQQLGNRDGSGVCLSSVRSFLAAIPIGSLATSIPHGCLHEGGSVSFAIEFAQDQPFP